MSERERDRLDDSIKAIKRERRRRRPVHRQSMAKVRYEGIR